MQETPHTDGSVLTTLFRHNAWANLALLEFCQGLSDTQLDTTAVGCFGSIRDTLQHIVVAEISYVNRVTGATPPGKLAPGEFPGFDLLKDSVRWTSDQLLRLAFSAQNDTRVQQRLPDQPLKQYPLASLIAQALTHSTEHRTQISAIITQMGMEPPDMSGWKYMETMGEIQLVDEEA